MAMPCRVALCATSALGRRPMYITGDNDPHTIGMEPVNVAASVFKAHCSRLLNEVASKGRTFVITKNGKPIARIEPVEPQESLEGSWKGLVEIKGDIVNFDKSKIGRSSASGMN